ncbi:MAG: cupin domain-containing protein [Promethearchaeota archaeon]|jgi:quercetin dioxygenase-like cupin family protein
MHIEKGEKSILVSCIDYVDDGVASKQIIKNKGGNITLFAFSKGEGLSEHTSPFDAFVYVLEGIAEILIDKNSNILKAGEMIIMPAGIPHALNANTDFKMLLVMVKPETN